MNTGGQAFPGPHWSEGETGMTLLDWMAGQETLSDFDHPEENMPLSGAIALAGPQPDEGKGWEPHFIWNAEWRAKMKYMRASAMLAEKARREADHCEDALGKVDHSTDTRKMVALEAANGELVEAFGRFLEYVTRVNGVAVFQEPLFAEMRAIIAKHKGAA